MKNKTSLLALMVSLTGKTTITTPATSEPGERSYGYQPSRTQIIQRWGE